LAGGHVKVCPHLVILFVGESSADAVQRIIHRDEPPVTGLFVNQKWCVTHAKPRVAPFLHIRRRPTPILNKKQDEVSLGLSQVLGVHRTQNLVVFNTDVEGSDEASEEWLSPNLLIE